VRPIKLEVQGLTAYKQRVEIDFSGLDLFAISGPTGAGKSSLVDAITYALFGEAPRVGDNIKQLISQGEERLRVNLEFAADGMRYRVHRATGHRGLPSVQIEHLDPQTGEWMPDADKMKDVNEHVVSILGMDYDGFVRSILLPQGQFQQFLAGKPEERRKVLDSLLRLDVYQQMLQRANQIADEHTNRAATLRQQLDTQYAGATPEALKAAEGRLAELRMQLEALHHARDALARAREAAETMSAALGRRQTAEAELAAAAKALEREEELLKRGQGVIDELDGRIKAAEAELAGNAYDVDLSERLKRALDRAQRLEQGEKRLAQMRREAQESGPKVQKLREKGAAAEKALESARAAVEEAEQALQRARTENLAVALRKGLRAGDPCPVCGQKVGALPAAAHVALDSAEERLKTARAAEKAAQDDLQALQKAVVAAERDAAGLDNQIERQASECHSERLALEELLGGRTATAAEIAGLVRIQEAARREHGRLTREIAELREQKETQSRAITEAGQKVARLEAESKLRTTEIETASAEASAAGKELLRAAKENGWPDVAAALDSGEDPAPALRARTAAADAAAASANQAIGACEKDIERIREGIKRAGELRREIEEATREGRLAKDLASLLKVTGFPNYIRESALRLLAQDGSRQLMAVSSGRYEFDVQGQQFFVVDHWNADETRSVKTLSGGETFLASLALALALAEHLPGLGAGARTHTLESLFIDEGFSNLDADTLEVVTNALEAIGQGGNRMVGVITHLPALAERMPARIVVHKTQAGSTVTVE
jgi:exonuclease SbcC